MYDPITLLLIFASSAGAMWFIWNHLAKKLKTQSTTDSTMHLVSRENNPQLYRFHVSQCYVALALLGVIAIASGYALVVKAME